MLETFGATTLGVPTTLRPFPGLAGESGVGI